MLIVKLTPFPSIDNRLGRRVAVLPYLPSTPSPRLTLPNPFNRLKDSEHLQVPHYG